MNSVVPGWLSAAIGHAKSIRNTTGHSGLGGGPGPDPDAYNGRTPPIDADVRMNRGTAGKPGGPSIA